jgi:hypothetical protein
MRPNLPSEGNDVSCKCLQAFSLLENGSLSYQSIQETNLIFFDVRYMIKILSFIDVTELIYNVRNPQNKNF